MKALAAVLLATMMGLLAGCNTVEGAGKDVKATGRPSKTRPTSRSPTKTSRWRKEGPHRAGPGARSARGPDPSRSSARSVNERFRHFAAQTSAVLGSPWSFLARACSSSRGPCRSVFSLLERLAARHQHVDDHRHVPHGVPAAEHAEPRHQGHQHQARRAPARDRRRAHRLADLSELTDEEIERLERELVHIARKAGVDPLPTDSAGTRERRRASRACRKAARAPLERRPGLPAPRRRETRAPRSRPTPARSRASPPARTTSPRPCVRDRGLSRSGRA